MAYNPIMKSTLRLNAKLFPVIGVIAFIMQILDPSRVWVILLIGFGGTWLVCWWWAGGLAKSLQFEREVRYGWAQVGDRLEERFTLLNDFVLPATWVTLFDHSTLPDHMASVATGVDRFSTSRWRILSFCTRRGVFVLGGTTLETGDPFGIYTVTIEVPTSTTVAVMPPVVPLPKFNILSKGWAGDGRTNPNSMKETINASHVREMTPDDPMRLIHWKTTARRGRYFVLQSDGTSAGDWWILLDLHKGSQLGTRWDSTEEHSVILTASLAAQGLQDEHSVGLAINGNEPAWHVPQRNEYQRQSILRSLALASPVELNLKDYLLRTGQSFGGHSSLLIVTACADIEWVQALLPLMWRGVLPTVFLLDQNTFGGWANTTTFSETLQAFGIPCHIIPRELLIKPEARPGHAGEWEWRVSGTGKAIPIHVPVTDWRRLE